ncbi:hypothetical protein ALC62_07539 [Cyphomyrmex costatus]|uniref:Myb/SANT-like DNA-binding domain-containing protein n=1 Tax=Cyphomyrmex costatus TaxID=456900 RepID=A0A151IHM1_9HYME|nr:hypothetical protein ALC62_07539 [Cyphomyrmex costatus]
MPQITLFDPNTENTYIIEVTKADAKRASEDLVFATYLLNKHLNKQSQIVSNLIPDEELSRANVVTNPAITTIITDTDASVAHDADNDTAQIEGDDCFQEKDSFRWPHEAILLLLQMYTDNEHHLTSGKTTHKKFWELIASKLIANGYNVTGVQCKSKMAGLKNTYKNVKDHNAKSGNSRRTWRYFEMMDEIFNKKPWAESLLTLESSSSSTTVTSADEKEDIPSKRSNSPFGEKKLPSKRKY